MKALIDSTGVVLFVVYDTAGYDLTGLTVIDNVPEPPHEFVWNNTTMTFDPRPPTAAEETAKSLTADPRWQAIKTATPDQIDAWLTANVTDLASARRVLKILVLAVQTVAKTRN